MSYINKFFTHANCIIPKSSQYGALWIGDYQSAIDPVFLKNNNITVIVNCSIDLPFVYDVLSKKQHGLMNLETFRIPVYDSCLKHDINIMEQYLHIVLPFLLKKLLIKKNNILVHCHAGAQRSAIVVAALLFLLIDKKLMKFPDIPNTHNNKSQQMIYVINYILTKRPKVFNYGFRVNFKSSVNKFFNINI